MSERDDIPSDDQTLAQDYEQRLSFNRSGSSRDIPKTGQGTPTPSDGERFGCPVCSYWALKERTVRSHFTRCEDKNHESKHGFLDDIEVLVFDNNGQQIATVASPKSKRLGEEVDESYLPDGVSGGTKAAEILKLAIHNPELSEKDITQEIYDDPDKDPSYAYRVLDENLVKAPETDVENAGEMPEFEELPEKHQKLIDAYVKDSDRPLAEIEREAGVATGYGGRTLEKFKSVIEERREAVEDGADLVLEQDDGEEESPEEVDKNGWKDLTETQQEIIETFVLNPDMERVEVDDKVGTSNGYTHRTIDKYEYLLDRLQLTVDSNEEADDEAPKTQPQSDGNESDQGQVELKPSEWLEIIRSLSKTDADDELLQKAINHAF